MACWLAVHSSPAGAMHGRTFAHNTQHTIRNTQHTTHNAQHTTHRFSHSCGALAARPMATSTLVRTRARLRAVATLISHRSPFTATTRAFAPMTVSIATVDLLLLCRPSTNRKAFITACVRRAHRASTVATARRLAVRHHRSVHTKCISTSTRCTTANRRPIFVHSSRVALCGRPRSPQTVRERAVT